MRSKAKAVLCIVLMTILAMVAFQGISRRLEGKDAYIKNGDFLRVADECDVLFLGTSHMTMTVYPMELWKDYGITSYNLSGFGHPMSMSYWTFINALDYANPKVVVLDCFFMESDEKVAEGARYMHFSLDSIPLSRNKVRAVCDLYDDFDSRAEYLWDFSLYHNRWDGLQQTDFEVEYEETRGAILEIGISEPKDFKLEDVEAEPVDSVGVEYLRKILEECQSRGIEVVLTFLPFPAQEDQQRVAAYAGEIAREYGVDYLNFLYMDQVDYQTDCFDFASHLNVAGGQKITSFIGEYLRENYELADHRQDGDINWDEDYAAYQRSKIDTLQSQESLQNHLVMMADKSFSYCFFVDGKSKIWDYEQYVNQVRNLVPDHELDVLEEAIEQGEDYCLIVDNLNGEVVEYGGVGAGTVETSFGKVTYTEDENGSKALYFGDSEESYLIEENQGGAMPTVQVILVNNLDGTVVNVERFDEMLRVTR